MKAVIATDHAAFKLKQQVIDYLKTKGYDVVDLGPQSEEPVSYAIQGHKLANYVINNKTDLAIGMCGTGLGINYALNRHKNIRAARSLSVEDAHLAKQHNDANVLVMAGRQTSFENAKKIIDEFISTKYEGGRHQARIEQIEEF